jgi:hypothetical protein
MIPLAIIAASGLLITTIAVIITVKRDAAQAERSSALAAAEAQTLQNLKTREAIDASVNADPDLAARARSVMHHTTKPK